MTDIPSLPEAHRRVAVAYLEALSLMSAAYQDRSGAVGFVGRLSGSEARILLIASVELVASALRVSENLAAAGEYRSLEEILTAAVGALGEELETSHLN